MLREDLLGLNLQHRPSIKACSQKVLWCVLFRTGIGVTTTTKEKIEESCRVCDEQFLRIAQLTGSEFDLRTRMHIECKITTVHTNLEIWYKYFAGMEMLTLSGGGRIGYRAISQVFLYVYTAQSSPRRKYEVALEF